MRHTEFSPEARPVVFGYQRGWRVLRLAVLGVVLATLAAAVMGAMAVGQRAWAEEVNLAALPQEVREAVDRAVRVYPQPLSGARWSEVSRLSGTAHPLFQLRGTNGRGNQIELEVTSAGRIIEVEEHGITLGEVPSAVTEALKAKLPDFKPTCVEAIYQNEKAHPVSYGFEGKDTDGSRIEVYISADGKIFLN